MDFTNVGRPDQGVGRPKLVSPLPAGRQMP